MDEYGPFVNVVAIALALVAVFSTLLLRAIGNIKHWTWLSSGAPPFMVTAGSRLVAVALMAITYVTINESNYLWFGVAAVVFGVFGFWSVVRFDNLRKLYIHPIPLIDKDGQQLVDEKGNPSYENIVIGLESQMRKEAKEAYDEAQKEAGGLSLPQFMSGYGATKVNDPEACWDRKTLTDISTRLIVTLMYIALSGVMALFLAAFVIEVAN